MSDILCRWLNNELRLSKTVEPNTFSKDFSTGYLIGEVLFKYQLQDDFSAFIKSNISSSKESNFSRIEPSLQLLGVPFDQNTAQALMQEKQGAATRLLYQLYVLLQHRKMKRTPMDTLRPTAGGPHLHKKENDVFSDHRVGPVGKRDAEVTLHKLSQRYEEQGRQLKEKSEMAELLQEQKKLLDQEDMRLKDMEKLRSSRRRQTELMARIQASIVHVPKPSAIKLVQKQHQQQQLRREQQRQQVTAEIARFEKSRKAFLTSDFSYSSSGKTLTGSRKAIGQNAPGEGGPELMLQSNSQYVQRIRQRLAEDSASCQQREKRRTRFLQEQLKAQENQQNAQRDDQLVRRLTRQTEQERRLVVQLLQVRAQKEVLRENRLFRERQYQEQRERDFLEALEREATLAQQAQLDEADEVSRQMELHNRMAAERAQHRHKKHSNLCREVLDQIEDLATKVGEYRLLTGKLIPDKMMREWKELLLLGLPLYDPVPGDSDPGPLSAPLDPVERQKEELLNSQDYQEYTNMEGEWAWPEEAGEAKRHLGSNIILDHVVLRLKNMVNEPRPATPPPLFPQFTLKACVLGQPCSGKSTCLAQLAQEHGIHIISPDTLIQEALAAYQSGEKVSDGGEIPTVRDGGDEVPEGEGRSSASLETKESNSLSALDQQQEIPKREPSARAQRGAVIDQVLRTGKAIPDELLVNIIVETIRLVPDTSGWVLDGFPGSVAQARMLELALGGSTSVPIEKKPPRRGSNKQKAPQALEPIAAKKLPVLDLVLLLDTPESVLLNRAVRQSRVRGERVLRSAEVKAPSPTVRSASLAIKEEHVETISRGAAPTATPDGHPDPGGKAPALDECADSGLGGRQIQHGIASFQDNWSKLEKWYSGNQGILVRLDANVSEEELFSSLESVLLQAVMNKPKVLDTGETPGSNPPGTAPHQDPKLERPGSACIVRPRSSAKSPRGRTRAASLCGADRELGSTPDGDPPRPGSARWIYVEEALPLEVPGALLSYWETISESYVRNIKAVMQNLRIERYIIIRHLFNIREEYKHYLSRPELNQEFVSQWQQDFNSSIPEDMRADTETKTELHQRLDDLRERLWDMSDKRREEDSQEKNSLVENGWLEDHKAFLINHFATLIQVELDRFQDTLSVLRDYYLGMCRQGTPPFPPTHFTCLPLVDARDYRDTAPVQGDSTDQAAKGASETEEDTVLQRKTQVIPLLDRSAVAPEPSVDGDLQKGVRDKNSHGKHISDVYKQALDAIKNLCEQASGELQPKKVEVVKEGQEEERSKVSQAPAKGTAKDKGKKTSAKKKEPPPTPPPEPIPSPPVKESSEEIHLRKLRAKMHKELSAALGHEVQVVKTRIGLVRGCALLSVRSLQRKAEETFSCMDQWLAAHYLSQMNSVDGLAEVVRYHIEMGSLLHSELVLDSNDFYLNGDLRMVASQAPLPRPSPLERPPHSILSVAQLEFLSTQLYTVAPSGLLSCAEFTSVLQDLISLRMGWDCLPEPWSSMSDAQVMEVVSLLTLESGLVDWRRFLLSAALPWPLPSLAQLLLLLQGFRTADPEATGSVDRDQYLQVELWFPSETAQPAPEDPTEPLPYNRLANLRKLFFQMFADHSSSPPRLDYARMLGYLAAHPEPGQGVVRALSLVLGRTLRHPAACRFVKSMPNINETREPGSPEQQAEPEGEKAEEEVDPRGSSGCDGVEQGVSVNALLAVLCHRDVHETAHAPGKTPEELTEDLQRVFGELGYGPQEHVPFSVLCQHPVVQELMEGSTRYQLIDIHVVLKGQESESEPQLSTAS